MPAGYSGTPLPQKLGVKPESTLVLVGAPVGWSIADLPPGVRITTTLRGTPDVIVAFVRSEADFAKRMDRLLAAVHDHAALWMAWPRKAGGHVSDLTEQHFRDVLLPTGLVDNKVAAIDDDWSGLRFVRRKELRGTKR